MIKSIKALTLLTLSLLLFGCNQSSSDATNAYSNLFPYAEGNKWTYKTVYSDSADESHEIVKITGKKEINGKDSWILSKQSLEYTETQTEEYHCKTSDQIIFMGGTDVNSLTNIAAPYSYIVFPLKPDKAFVRIDKENIAYGSYDPDIASRVISIKSLVKVMNPERVNVDAGVFENCLKLVTETTINLSYSNGVPIYNEKSTLQEWYAPEIGKVKEVLSYQHNNLTTTETRTLIAYYVNGKKSENTLPSVVSVYPENGSLSGNLYDLKVVFSERMDPWTINNSFISVKNSDGDLTGGDLFYDNQSFFYTPYDVYSSGLYEVKINSEVEDLAGNHLADSYTWSFSAD